jgi:hypothetical protein
MGKISRPSQCDFYGETVILFDVETLRVVVCLALEGGTHMKTIALANQKAGTGVRP